MASPYKLYKELLLNIAREITREELEEMKFLSDEFLPDIKPESIFVREVFTFFRGLESAGRLGENNLDWLKYLLRTVKRSDLVLMLAEDFQPTNDEAMEGANSPPRGSPHGQFQTESETNDVDQTQFQACEDGSKEQITEEEDNKDENNKDENNKEENNKEENTKAQKEAEKIDVADEDAAQKRKREKRRRQKEKRKAAKCLSNEKDDKSTNEVAATVEKERKEPGKSGQNVKKDQETPEGANNQEFLDKGHHGKGKREVPAEQKRDAEEKGGKTQEFLDKERHHGKGKREARAEQKRNAEEKGGIPAKMTREDRPRPADEPKSQPSREKTEVPKKKNQVVKDDQKNKQGQPGVERMHKVTKNEKVPQQTEMKNPDLPSEVKMAAGDEDSTEASLRKMCILSLCNKWQSWGESIPVINRELCLALARAGHRVVCLVLTSSELDKEEARRGNVELIQCTEKPGINEGDPQLFYHEQPIPFLPNLVIGHGKLTGPAAMHHADTSSCPRLHIIHDHPKEYAKYDEIVNDQCDEVKLAMSADFTAAVGTLLMEEWSALMNRDVIEIIPGLPDLTTRNSISSPQCRCFVPAKFSSPVVSGLRTALMAVNNSSKRESRPRRTTIIVRNTDSNATEAPSEILKECDKSRVDLVERPGNNCQEAYIDIQGATVFLSPARVEAFGVAALDAIAIGIPIVISAHSGLAFTIRKHFDEQFHCSMKERGEDDDIDEDDDADIWAMEIDKVAVKTAETFASADKLRSEWKKKFTWDKVAKQLMTIIVKSGKISSSPADQLNAVLTRHVAPSCLDLVKDLNLFDKRQKCVLFLSPEDPQQLKEAVHLGLVHWAAVFDFDRESAKNGYLKSCETLLQSIGKPACRMIPPLKEETGKETSQIQNLPNGIPWILLQGLPNMEINIGGSLDWVQEILHIVKKKYPNPMTILIIWKATEENKNLCKVLCKILTLVQASPSWKNSVKLQILSTSTSTDSRLEDIAEEWGVKSNNIDISQLFKAIYSTAISNPLYQVDPDFSLPKADASSTTGDVTCASLPSSMRWVDSVLEVLYASIGNTPEFGKDDAHHFYRGGKISWYGIEMDYAVERESWEGLRNGIEEELGYPGAAFLTLLHQRGTGGTTSARKLLYDFHLRYPCVCLKTINYETFLAINEIWKFCSLPVIILADIKDVSGSDDNDIQALFERLSNEKVSCLILHIVHRHQVDRTSDKEPKKKKANILAKRLTEKEIENFVEVYTYQCPLKISELAKMRYADHQLQIPFYYGLVAFEDRFKGLEPYVSDCLQGLNDSQRTALCFLSMAYHYARRELPLSALAPIFKLKPRQLHSIDDILSPESIELLIEEDGCWRPRHFTIGIEVLRQLLTVPFKIHRDNWKRNLADKAMEFVSCMEEEVTSDILLNRISDEKTQKHFSSLVEDIPESEDVVNLFKKAISIYPKNPYFKVHLGRYYSVKMGIDGFREALEYTDDGILLASGKPKNVRSQLTQMRGIVYKRQVKNLIDRKADLMDVILLAEEGVKSFTRAVSISSDKQEDAYIPQVRMMCDVFRYINLIYEGGVFEYAKLPNAHRLIVDGVSGETSDILESVSESIFYPDLRRELFKLGVYRTGSNKAEDKADLIKHLQELKKTSKASTAPINRQIVLIKLDQCKEKNKSISEVAEELKQLLEEALKYDTKIDLTMRLWVKVAPHIPVDLQTAESKIAAWCNKGKTALAYLYRYIFTCIRIIEGGRDQSFEEERISAQDNLLKLVRDTSRINLRHADRPVVFLGTTKGMGQIVTLERESVKEVRKQRTIPDNYASQLRRLTGIIISTGKVGQIKAAGLTISFRADLCQPPLVGEFNVNKRVRFYLAFTYFQTDAYNVKVVAE